MQIETYSGKYDDEIIVLILGIQNNESKIGLSIEEQPDLLDIRHNYQENGGEFWIALSDGEVVGAIGLMLKEKHCAIMKKFFVKKEYRSQKTGLALYRMNIRTETVFFICWIYHARCRLIAIPKHDPISKVYVERVRQILGSEAVNDKNAE